MANNLGKGLEALIKSYSTENKEKYLNQDIDVNKIIPNKNQPRVQFDSEKMQSLIKSIKLKGILQPLSVRKIIPFTFGIFSSRPSKILTKLISEIINLFSA